MLLYAIVALWSGVSVLVCEGACQPINTSMCLNIHDNWNYTFLPNIRGHTTQDRANIELNDFLPLIRSNCSDLLVKFLCAVYVPFCTETPSEEAFVVLPCRELCEQARNGCEPLLIANGFMWPDHLFCDLYPITQPCLDILDEISTNTVTNTQHSSNVLPSDILYTGLSVSISLDQSDDFCKFTEKWCNIIHYTTAVHVM